MNNRFVFVAPAYNATKTIERMLMSIALQTYDNWLIMIRDDMSTDGTADFARQVAENQGFSDRLHLVENTEKLWEMQNVLKMIRDPLVQDNDIIVRIDGDDFLTDLCGLQDVNAVYEETECDVLYSAHRWSSNWNKNISGPIPGGYAYKGKGEIVKFDGEKDIYKWSMNNWSTSHMKTFRKYLINDVNEVNFKGKDGEYIRRTGDRALYYPIIHKSKMTIFLPRQLYYYTIDDVPETYSTDDAKFQKSESDFLSLRGFIK